MIASMTIPALMTIIGSVLIFTLSAFALVNRWLKPGLQRTALAAALAVVALLPLGETGNAFFLAGVTGGLSLTSIMLAVVYMTRRCLPQSSLADSSLDFSALYLLLSVIGVALYPATLGSADWDIYGHGYYPIILGPLLLGLTISGIYLGGYWFSAILSGVFLGFAFGVLESDNLFDYLLDPFVTVFCLTRVRGAWGLLRGRLDRHVIEAILFSTGSALLLFAVYLSQVNPDAFRYQFVAEDGLIESVTALSLFAVMLISGRRLIHLRKHRAALFLGMTGFLALAGLFGAGEEISWGQRIFGWQTPEYFLENNKQEETGLHNLVVEVDGKKVNLNKVIFGTGLALALIVYLFIMTPLYRRQYANQGPFVRLIDQFAIPMPRNVHIIGYLVVIATVELLIDSSKRGEMTEFAGAIVFLLNVAFPYNSRIFEDVDLSARVP